LDDMTDKAPVRGTSQTTMRDVRCKDCAREIARGMGEEGVDRFEYSESWGEKVVNRGGTRSDRCPRHRMLHKQAIQGIAVAYIDLQTIGEVSDRQNPGGPLGGLGELPDLHSVALNEVDLAPYQFGMSDADILEILQLLSEKQVLILRAGTGTGKSTFVPFRLMNPPKGAALRLVENGPIVVTEPRVQATIGVARFVGEKLVRGCNWMECSQHGPFEQDHPPLLSPDCVISECSRHIGSGFPVGYQVKGNKNHDDSCQLIYATDGTVLNWLREGRLARVGAVIIDEAHERNVNIDLILGLIRRTIERYPHLRVIVTSATFDVDFYVDFFGGAEKVAWKDVPSVKMFGYGEPLFAGESIADMDQWLRRHWPERMGPVLDDGYQEDLWATTRILHGLRLEREIDPANWRTEMPDVVARFVCKLVDTLDREGVYGDVLAFLATEKTIIPVVEAIRTKMSSERADVYALLATIDTKQKEAALAARPRGARRKIVVSTNLAETSLTVSGVRFVVDSGLICQEEWDPAIANRSLPTKPHSQAGIRQRWGRVGRDCPGWAFPLYSRAQFDTLPRDTAPASARNNLEQLVVKAAAAGIDDLEGFPWPAAHVPSNASLDDNAQRAMENFTREIARSRATVGASGLLDSEGHLTAYGKELERFSGVRSAAFAIAVMYADQLACLPEVVTALVLLEDKSLVGEPKSGRHYLLPEKRSWPAEWRVQAAGRHAALYVGCRDDLDLVLRICCAWERVDTTKPWQRSDARREWAAGWWLDHEVLLAAAETRREILEMLSAKMKQEVTRPVEPKLVFRARAVISRSLQSFEYQMQSTGEYVLSLDTSLPAASVSRGSTLTVRPKRIIALRRTNFRGKNYLESIVEVYPWATEGSPSPMQLLQRCASECSPRSLSPHDIDQLPLFMQAWPVGSRYYGTLQNVHGDQRLTSTAASRAPFSYTVDLEKRDAAEEKLGEAETEDTAEEVVGTDWPTGNQHPKEDQTIVDRFALVDPSDPELGIETNDDDDTRALVELPDVAVELVEWAQEASSVMVERPLVVSDPETVSKGLSWIVCTGYDLSSEGEIRLRIDRDWLAPDMIGDPSVHADLLVGREIGVIVGPILSDGRGQFRSFFREDGRGRFLLTHDSAQKRRQNDTPIALDPSDRMMLSGLVEGSEIRAMVVPGPAGTRSISLLSTLSAHLDKAEKQQLPAPGDTSGKRLPFWPGVLLEAPSGESWGRVELLHNAKDLGILHTFGLSPKVRGIDEVVPTVGASVLVQLRIIPANLSGPRELFDEMVQKFPGFVWLKQQFDEGGRPTGSLLMSKRKLTQGLRQALVVGSRQQGWERRVWDFYLQSHLRRVNMVLPCADPSM
jgi:HrpA-like RNA helicase